MRIASMVAPARARQALACLLALGFVFASPVFAAAVSPAVGEAPITASFSVDWLEPQGLNISDLAGQVPDDILRGSIISGTPGYGIVRYASSGQKNGIKTITATASTRFVTDRGWSGSMFGCLGQPARMDQLGSAAPASTMRAYYQGRDITREILFVSYVPSGKVKPIRNPRESEAQNQYRYWETSYAAPSFTPDNQISLPANMGCELIVSERNYPELTLVYSIATASPVRVTLLGSQTFTFRSYLGPGFTGLIDPLVRQLWQAGYGFRAEKFNLAVPGGTDYFYLNAPTTPVDAYTAFLENPLGNVNRPSGGSYRIGIPGGLSVDHVNSMGLPLRGHWQDSDQAQGEWLAYANSYIQLSAPEYYVPAGVSYDPCMVSGGCPAEVLRAVYNTPMTMTIAYLDVQRVSANLERLPVQMVGSGYRAAASAAATDRAGALGETLAAGTPATITAPTAGGRKMYFPGISAKQVMLPPDDPTGCSTLGGCGWFTPDGRMVDYIPRP